MAADPTINGHPTVEIPDGAGGATLITVCAGCGRLRTILFLARDRWLCTACRLEGVTAPNLYPVA